MGSKAVTAAICSELLKAQRIDSDDTLHGNPQFAPTALILPNCDLSDSPLTPSMTPKPETKKLELNDPGASAVLQIHIKHSNWVV